MAKVKQITREPTISVGLMTGAEDVRFRLSGQYTSASGHLFAPGAYHAVEEENGVRIRDPQGTLLATSPKIELTPSDPSACMFTLAQVTIGIGFHWQRQQELSFQGRLGLEARPGRGLTVINTIPLESYLCSVISSEMSAACPLELLKAHAVISRSWLLAQLSGQTPDLRHASRLTPHEIIRWSRRENHTDFDVCADDHCQRYQGVTKAFSPTVFDAVRETRGLVLTYADEICDARFSKCCGGMTENYRAAWEDVDMPYLAGVYDGTNAPAGFSLPLTQESAAEQWIMGSPPAHCNTSDGALIERILPDYDQETRDFFRWEVGYQQDELQAIVKHKLNIDVGGILGLEPLERGVSGRIIKLRILGEKAQVVVGKELEIRRALSSTHLYSSAFVVRSEGGDAAPQRFRLIGAGWGHGVGLCQIGAAVMAQQGKSYREILAHYYRHSSLRDVYAASAPPSTGSA